MFYVLAIDPCPVPGHHWKESGIIHLALAFEMFVYVLHMLFQRYTELFNIYWNFIMQIWCVTRIYLKSLDWLESEKTHIVIAYIL